MTASRRHSMRPVVVEVKPDNLPSIIAPSSPSSPGAKKVSFASSGDKVSRPLTSTEAWSLYHFESHARTCPQCCNPLEVLRRGDRLCDAGHWLAEDVACHVYHKEGDIYSIKKDDSKLVRVEIPPGYSHLRGLLKGMDRTLRSHRTLPILSYDRSYPISSRKPDTTPESVIVEPASSTAHRRSRHNSLRYSTVAVNTTTNNNIDQVTATIKPPLRRGTLYEKDMQRKEKNYRVEIREPKERRPRRADEADETSRRKSAVYYYE